MNEPTFYIWSFEHDAWWGLNCMGYVKDWKKAGQYSLESATDICECANAHGLQEAMVPTNKFSIHE